MKPVKLIVYIKTNSLELGQVGQSSIDLWKKKQH